MPKLCNAYDAYANKAYTNEAYANGTNPKTMDGWLYELINRGGRHNDIQTERHPKPC